MGEFVGLDAYVRARERGAAPSAEVAVAAPPPAAARFVDTSRASEPHRAREQPCACERLVDELGLARLAALEAFDRARSALLERLANDVLARELALGPVDLAALAARALEAFARCEPVTLVVAPGAAARMPLAFPVREDAALAPHDLALDVRDGEIDARFALRLAAALRATEDA